MNNIKVDIIYYTISSDFEMEFNLCGCCRMRLLTDTVNTRNDFSKSLARAVNRSNIIIACGPIFGEKGLVSTVSKVTSVGIEKINNSKYGIDGDAQINVLKGSTPLVSSDGIFGGCIIENGPQVIILLTESKSLRKKIMKELIHPYVSQWSFVSIESGVTPKLEPIAKKTNKIVVKVENDEKTDDTEEEQNRAYADNDDFVMTVDNNAAPLSGSAEANNAYYDFSLDSGGRSVEKQNLRYYLEDADDSPLLPKNTMSPFLIVLIVLAIILAFILLFLTVIRPAIHGLDISEYIKNSLTPRSQKDMLIFLTGGFFN